MRKLKSFILEVLRLVTPHELKELTKEEKILAKNDLDKEEVLLWQAPEEDSTEASEKKILSFKKKSSSKAAEKKKDESEEGNIADVMLLERDKFRESEEKIYKQSGLASYRKNSDLGLYRVTVTDDKGKEKTRVTSTLGVLVDKKQA